MIQQKEELVVQTFEKNRHDWLRAKTRMEEQRHHSDIIVEEKDRGCNAENMLLLPGNRSYKLPEIPRGESGRECVCSWMRLSGFGLPGVA